MKFTDYQKIVLRQNIMKHGATEVLIKMIEEAGEMNTAIAKYLLSKTKEPELVNNIIDEIADNYVVLEQLKMIYGERYIQDRIDFKIDRLDKRNNTNTI